MARLKSKVSEHNQEKRVGVAGLLEFLAEVGNEALDAKSHFEEVVGSGLPRKLPVGWTRPLLMKRKKKKILIHTSNGSGSRRHVLLTDPHERRK